MSSIIKPTSNDVITAVRTHFKSEKDSYGPEYAALTEFSLSPGGRMRRADLYLVRAWSGKPKGHERILIEVKVSRSDFTRELSQPEKLEQLSNVSHLSYFATTEDVVRDTDDIGNFGHILVKNGTAKIVKRAVRNTQPLPLPEGAFVEAMRRASRAEARERHALSDDPVSQILKLQAANRSLENRVVISAIFATVMLLE